MLCNFLFECKYHKGRCMHFYLSSEIDLVVDDEGPRNRQSSFEDPIEYENVGSVEYVEPRKSTTYTIKDLKAKLSKATIKEDLGKEYKVGMIPALESLIVNHG